jgi:hypothetical protein
MGEATIRLSRAGSLSPLLGMETYNISVDGRVVGAIAAGETVEVSVTPGRHSLLLQGRGRNRSPLRALEVAEEEVVSYRCHGPWFWPLMVAAQVKPSLWISLRPG